MFQRCPAWSTRSPSSASTVARPSRAWPLPGWWATRGRRPSGWTSVSSLPPRASFCSTSRRRTSRTPSRTSAWISPRSAREAKRRRWGRCCTSIPPNPSICRSRSPWRRANPKATKRNQDSWRCAATARTRSPTRSPRRTPTSTPSRSRRSCLRPARTTRTTRRRRTTSRSSRTKRSPRRKRRKKRKTRRKKKRRPTETVSSARRFRARAPRRRSRATACVRWCGSTRRRRRRSEPRPRPPAPSSLVRLPRPPTARRATRPKRIRRRRTPPSSCASACLPRRRPPPLRGATAPATRRARRAKTETRLRNDRRTRRVRTPGRFPGHPPACSTR